MNCITGWAWGVYDEERANIELDGYRDPLKHKRTLALLLHGLQLRRGLLYVYIIAGKQNLRQKTSL
jgi:hypothetical protein